MKFQIASFKMKFNLILVLGTAILVLLTVLKGSQYVMMRYLSWNFDLIETVLLPAAVLGSFIVGYFLANRPGKSEPTETEE